MITGRVDEIWIAVEPEMSRVMFLTAGTVVEIWHEFAAAPKCIGEVHQLKIDQVFGGQNRATARLDDGTPVSLRVTSRDKVQAGQSMTATIIAAPRQGKPWQAAIGARLVGTYVSCCRVMRAFMPLVRYRMIRLNRYATAWPKNCPVDLVRYCAGRWQGRRRHWWRMN